MKGEKHAFWKQNDACMHSIIFYKVLYWKYFENKAVIKHTHHNFVIQWVFRNIKDIILMFCAKKWLGGEYILEAYRKVFKMEISGKEMTQELSA